ncbi:hypothetical protein [Actinoalloteichus caeruleus]|uniref:hypothetical protein n=1 Tax=Actinoalloteichus cyanogriseus TaxID=2893586 RepID=UPI000ADF67BA|nr:hypothetical protein [Actinoalloteichus caeruleus]
MKRLLIRGGGTIPLAEQPRPADRTNGRAAHPMPPTGHELITVRDVDATTV